MCLCETQLQCRTHEVSKLVKFEGECDGESNELVSDCKEECNGEIVIVQHVDRVVERHLGGISPVLVYFRSGEVPMLDQWPDVKLS